MERGAIDPDDRAEAAPVVVVQDAGGNTVITDTSEVTLAIIAGPAEGDRTLIATLSVPAVAGVATFADVAVKGAGAGYQLQATDGSLTAADCATFAITTRAITLTAATATMAFSGSTLCASPTSGSCTPSVATGTPLATDDSMTASGETFATALPGTGITLAPAITKIEDVTDPLHHLDFTSSYNMTPENTTGSITGTVLFAPASVSIGSGFPGQMVTSAEASVEWLSTESTKDLMVTLAGPLSDGAAPTPHTTAADHVWFGAVGRAFTQMIDALTVASLGADPPHAHFQVRVTVPSVPAGTYSGTIT